MRTLKENLLWIRSFNTIEELRVARIAAARKLVVTLNAMLASGTDYRPAAVV